MWLCHVRRRSLKTIYCLDINETLLGREVELYGWVQIKREHGGVIFIDLRDRSGIVQLVFGEQYRRECFEKAFELKSEYVIRASGEVRERENPNPEIPTGRYEVWVKELYILNTSKTIPIGVVKQNGVTEELRLRYRYIDLRRSEMQQNLLMRHRIVNSIRSYLNEQGFIDIETPFLTKSTPEGARDFIVPSRVSRGKFYALPQSPQIFKQILMVSGFEKYYQIVRCFRDEDLRADRQPEFTQVDIEASFIDEKCIFDLVDGMFERLLDECYGKKLSKPVRRFEYDDVMELYGTDRPDLRSDITIQNLCPLGELKPKDILKEGLGTEKFFYGLAFPASEKITRKFIDSSQEKAKREGVNIFTWLRHSDGATSGPMTKLFEADITEKIKSLTAENNFVLFAAHGKKSNVLPFLGNLRVELSQMLGFLDRNRDEFCWVVHFPLFEWSEEEGKIVSVHHPFTAPRTEDIPLLDSDIFKVKSRSYDFVYNGIELGGGSIRIHNSELQQRIFTVLGLEKREVEEKFGFLIDALQFGAPPHGGIAFGLDRIVMMLQRLDSIRDVIAFPKTTSGACLLSGAPDAVSKKQLKELGLRTETER